MFLDLWQRKPSKFTDGTEYMTVERKEWGNYNQKEATTIIKSIVFKNGVKNFSKNSFHNEITIYTKNNGFILTIKCGKTQFEKICNWLKRRC